MESHRLALLAIFIFFFVFLAVLFFNLSGWKILPGLGGNFSGFSNFQLFNFSLLAPPSPGSPAPSPVRLEERKDPSPEISKEDQMLIEARKRINNRRSALPPGFTIKDVSPFYDLLSISASPTRSSLPSRILITASRLPANELVEITGWKLNSNQKQLFIAQAVYNVLPDMRLAEGPIRVKKGDKIHISSASTSFSKNIRANKCFGYLKNRFNNIDSSITSRWSCPAEVNRGQFYHLSGQCQNFVNRLGRCPVLIPDEINKLDNQCRAAILGKFTYASCYNNFSKDKDFYSPDWYVWAGLNILDPFHDWVVLTDSSGRLVADYRY